MNGPHRHYNHSHTKEYNIRVQGDRHLAPRSAGNEACDDTLGRLRPQRWYRQLRRNRTSRSPCGAGDRFSRSPNVGRGGGDRLFQSPARRKLGHFGHRRRRDSNHELWRIGQRWTSTCNVGSNVTYTQSNNPLVPFLH